jgi:hypothetical protein
MTEILGMWTEPEAGARRAAIPAHFDEGVHFHDPDGEFAGHAGLQAFSDTLQNRFRARGSRSRNLCALSATPSPPSGTSGRPAHALDRRAKRT